MTPDDSCDDLITRARNSDESAQTEIFNRYQRRLAALASNQLNRRRYKHLVEPDEVVNSVMKSFFQRLAKGEYEIDGWISVWSLIVQMVVNKCRVRDRYYFAQKRDVARTVSPTGTDEDNDFWQRIADEPSEKDAAKAAQTIERLFHELRSERTQRVLRLLLEGRTQLEVSKEIGLSERTVRREIKMARTVLLRIINGDE